MTNGIRLAIPDKGKEIEEVPVLDAMHILKEIALGPQVTQST